MNNTANGTDPWLLGWKSYSPANCPSRAIVYSRKGRNSGSWVGQCCGTVSYPQPNLSFSLFLPFCLSVTSITRFIASLRFASHPSFVDSFGETAIRLDVSLLFLRWSAEFCPLCCCQVWDINMAFLGFSWLNERRYTASKENFNNSIVNEIK